MGIGEIAIYVVVAILFIGLLYFLMWLRTFPAGPADLGAGYFRRARVSSVNCLARQTSLDRPAPSTRWVSIYDAKGNAKKGDTWLHMLRTKDPNKRNNAWVTTKDALEKGDYTDCCKVLMFGTPGPAEAKADICIAHAPITFANSDNPDGTDESYRNVFPYPGGPQDTPSMVNALTMKGNDLDLGETISLIRCGGEGDLPCVPEDGEDVNVMSQGCSQTGDGGLRRLYRFPPNAEAQKPYRTPVQRCQTAAWLNNVAPNGYAVRNVDNKTMPLSPWSPSEDDQAT